VPGRTLSSRAAAPSGVLAVAFLLCVLATPGGAGAQPTDSGVDGATTDASVDAGAEDPAVEVDSGVGAVAISPAAIAQEARDATAQLQADAELVEGSPVVGSVRARLESSDEDLAGLEQRVAPGAIAAAGRSDLTELTRRVGGLDGDRADDEEALDARLAELSELTSRLENARNRWSDAERELRATPGTPALVVQRSEALLRRIDELHRRVAERTSAVAELQHTLAEHRETASHLLERLHEAQHERRARLFSRTAPPIWAASTQAGSEAASHVSIKGSWSTFYTLYGDQLPLHVGLFILLLIAVVALGRWSMKTASGADHASLAILSRPFAAALMLGLVAIRFVYPRAPTAIFHAAAAFALIPLLRLLPTLIRRRALHRPIWALLGLFAAHEISASLPLSPPLPRILSLLVTLVFLTGTILVLRRGYARPEDEGASRLLRAVPRALQATVVLLSISALAEIFGYSNLASLLTPGLLDLGYVLFLLLAAVRVLDAVLSATLRSPFAQVSRTVRFHRDLIEAKIRSVLQFLTAAGWLYGALMVFDLEDPAQEMFSDVFNWQANIGSWSLSLGDLVGFGLVVWLTRYVSRILSFLLEQDVLPRLNLPRGAPATVSRLARYGVWLIGFIAAIGAAGVDMSSIALLVSALGVGIGFGLQTIVNNFVSGLILIFERPIRTGDMVEVDGMVGRVREIGIRASVVRTLKGAEVILPNADLVSGQVINWTLSDQRRRVDVPVGVAYGTDPQRVIDLLLEASRTVPEVSEKPETLALFLGFGASSLDFELRFWVDLKHEWPTVASLVLVAIHARLMEAKIEIPFPQRDLHVRSIAPEAAAAIFKEDSRGEEPSV